MSYTDFYGHTGKCYYTFLIHSTSVIDTIAHVKEKLDKINKIVKNAYRKKLINERLYSFRKYLEDLKQNTTLNSIFFIGKNINHFLLSKEQLAICLKWNLKNVYYEYDTHFKIDYLDDLFDESNISNVLEFDRENVKLVEMDNVKYRIANTFDVKDTNDVEELFSKYKPKLIHGSGSLIKKIKINTPIFKKKLLRDTLIKEVEKIDVSSNLIKLDNEVLSQMTNPKCINLFMFGKKEVGKGIMNFMIKKLFITAPLLKKLQNKLEPEKFNFEVTVIKSLEPGDIGSTFISNYEGIIGIKYY